MTTHILILCTHNSARSIMAEAMLNHLARQHGKNIRGHSAGSAPVGRVNAHALAVLQEAGVETLGLRSKSWDDFTQIDAPKLRLVITVCHQAAAEVCPYWPGGPLQAHWGYADPSRTEGDESAIRNAFELTRQALSYRLLQLVELPIEDMDDLALRAAVTAIGKS